MFKLFNRSKTTNELAELMRIRDQVNRESAEVRAQLGHARHEVQVLLARLVEAEPAILRYQEASEQAIERIAKATDAQAARYHAIEKRLNAFDQVFKALGVVVTAASRV